MSFWVQSGRFLSLFLLCISAVARADSASSFSPWSVLPKTHEAWISRDYESGVINRLRLDYFGRYWLSEIFALDVGAGASVLEQSGLTLLGVSAVGNFPNARSFIVLSLQHQNWPAWTVTENRVVLYWDFHPIDTFSIALGMGYLNPQIASRTWQQWLALAGANSEFSVLYRVDWRVLSVGLGENKGFAGLSAMIWNYDRMQLYTSDNIHFSLKAVWSPSPVWSLMALVGTATKGYSGGIISWDQNEIALGATFAP